MIIITLIVIIGITVVFIINASQKQIQYKIEDQEIDYPVMPNHEDEVKVIKPIPEPFKTIQDESQTNFMDKVSKSLSLQERESLKKDLEHNLKEVDEFIKRLNK